MAVDETTKICGVVGCDKVIRTGSDRMCGSHRYRRDRYKEQFPLKPFIKETKTDTERFWSKVALTADISRCWEWKSMRGKQAYPSFMLNGHNLSAHRAAWILTNGDPCGLWVLHDCDNKRCVNPNHLHLGTPKQNTAEARDRGLITMTGSNNPRAVLNADTVREIKTLFHGQGKSYREISRTLNVKYHNVQSVILGRCWGHVGV